MVDSNASTVLIVVGDPIRAELVVRALRHPSIATQVATNEQEILAALKQNKFMLAVVGGHIGRRDPLVICEAVRVRQPGLPTLVLIGTEITADALSAHRQRQLEGVFYVDLGPNWDQAKEKPSVGVGDAVRQEVLGKLGLVDDPQSHQAWVNAHEAAMFAATVQNEATVVAVVPPALISQASAPLSEAPTTVGPAPSAPAKMEPPKGALTDDDFAFAARVAEQTRGTDFRTPFVPTRATDDTGAERTVLTLRDKIRELERNLARMAAVYAKRAWTFDTAEEQIRDLEAARASIEKDHERLREHLTEEKERAKAERAARESKLAGTEKDATELQAHVVELTASNAQYAKEIERRDLARTEMERNFTAMLKQAQDAFNALRDQSARALGDYERQLNESRAQTQAVQSELLMLNQEAVALRQRVQQADGDAPRMEQALTAQSAQFLEEKQQWVAQHAQLTQELTLAREEMEQERSKAVKAQHDLEELSGDALRLQQEMAQNASALASAKQAGEADRRALEQKWLQKFEQIKQAVLNLRSTQTVTEDSLRVKESELAGVQATLHSRDDEINQLQKAHKDVTDALARERVGFAEAMEAKLDALERFARETSERMVRLVEALATLDQMARRQEVLTEQLLSRGPIGVLPAIGAVGDVALPSRLPTDAGMTGMRRPFPSLGSKSLWRLDAKQSRIVMIGAAVFVVLVLLVWGLWPSGSHKQALSEGAAIAEPQGPGKDKQALPVPSISTAARTAAPDNQEPAEPKEDAAPAVAPALRPAVTLSEGELRVLRQTLMVAFKQKKWAEATKAGERMREGAPLDWEAEFTLGRAEQAANKLADAVETYLHFADQFPSNRYSIDATVSAARILAAQGKKAQARTLLQHATTVGNATVRAKAALALKQLK